jgi:transcriptional regulator with PAS, ATPase and Fis domain
MSEETSVIRGVLLLDSNGKTITTTGLGSDPRARAIVSDREWLVDAKERRLVPILFADRRLTALVTPMDDGWMVVLSEPPSDAVFEFMLSVDFAFDIIEHILTDPYDAMAVVDKQERLAYISPIHEKFFGLLPGEAIGRKVKDVIEGSRLPVVVRTGVAEVGQVHTMRGKERIVNRHPIRHKGEVVGAIGRIMFKGPQQVEAMARRINALERQIETYKTESRNQTQHDKFLDAIIGQSIAIQSVREQIRKIAPLDIPVLIQGQSGTGKELVAQALHMLSARRDGRLVTVNAAALPESLVESELFGYEAGSFTGADRKGRAGKFELADKGTIFLDEIGDMPLEVQSKLLRVLQDRMVERVGGEKPKRVDFRLCSATNRDLESMVEQNKFRLDLFYRISPVCIAMPSLAERLEDIPLLLKHFVSELARDYNREMPEIDPDIAPYLMERSWPGNIRQLRHVVERAMVFCEPERLRVKDFVGDGAASASGPISHPQSIQIDQRQLGAGRLQDSVDALETQLINDAIIRFKGNKKKAAEHLGVSRSYLYKKIEASGLSSDS